MNINRIAIGGGEQVHGTESMEHMVSSPARGSHSGDGVDAPPPALAHAMDVGRMQRSTDVPPGSQTEGPGNGSPPLGAIGGGVGAGSSGLPTQIPPGALPPTTSPPPGALGGWAGAVGSGLSRDIPPWAWPR